MPNQYDENIYFPTQNDVFPSLRDNTSSQVGVDEIVFAEHFNKVVNLVRVVEPMVLTSVVASGDATILGLGYIFNLGAKLSDVFKIYAERPANDLNINQPGNVLPFEFIVTASSDTYYLKQNDPAFFAARLIFQLPTTQGINETVGSGVRLFAITPLVTCTLTTIPYSEVSLNTTSVNTKPLTGFLLSYHCIAGSDTFIIRGAVTNTSLASSINQSNSDSWLRDVNDLYLNACIMGVRQ